MKSDYDHPAIKFSCHDLYDMFPEINMKITSCDMNTFKSRGLQRNMQLQSVDNNTDYVLFADCDHLYDYYFFDQFIDAVLVMEGNNTEKSPYLYTTSRVSTDDLDKVDELINGYHYPEYIPNTVELYTNSVNMRTTTAPGAGNTQMVKYQDIPDGVYVKSHEDRDRNFFKSITYRSDRVFRSKYEGVMKVGLSAKQYHLQHRRYAFNNLVQQ
jgi:hypothetical protein